MYNLPSIELEYGIHKRHPVVFVRFEYNHDIITRLKKYTTAKWSQTKGCWYIFEDKFAITNFKDSFKKIALIKVLEPGTKTEIPISSKYAHRDRIILPTGYCELLEQKRYSKSTCKTYTSYFKDFMHNFQSCDLKKIETEEINEYILSLIQLWNISGSEQNQRINAIKFYYEKVLGREKQFIRIERPRKKRTLPDILSKTEIQAILEVTANIKHRCMLELIYSAGLRRSELLNLKLEDIDSKRMLVKIRGGKGRKDRYTLLSDNVLKHLRQYFIGYKPSKWLFEGTNKGQYTSSSITRVLKNSAKKAGIKKRVHLHMLCHSFATHLLEQGTNLRLIQTLLGHESIQTTEIYTHVSNLEVQKVINPIDEIINRK